jgi:heme-degrading monooxygenase HmoA
MSKAMFVVGLAVITAAFCGCAEPKPAESPATTSAKEPAPASSAGSIFLRMKVADFAKWKTTFDEFEPLRKSNGMLGHTVSRDVKDDKTVLVHFWCSDLAKAQGYMASPELKGAMMKAGVQGPPVVWSTTDVEHVGTGGTTALVVRHPVGDFAKWRGVFDGLEAKHREAGFVSWSVHRDARDPSQVVVHLVSASPEKAAAWAQSDTLKSAMANASVSGPPDIAIAADAESKTY